MSLPTPPKYVVIPHEKIEQAYAPDKPRRALLATYIRILSLAWESKYEKTPRLNEEELIAFLKLSRRQYFEQKADMELLQWLRSSHPVPGFVQFNFSRSMPVPALESVFIAQEEPSAENRTDSAENRTDFHLIGGGGSLINLNTESPPPTKEEASAENRTSDFPSVAEILKHTDLLFDHSVVESQGLEHCIPEEVLAWCAYAYYQFSRGRSDRPAGLVRANLLKDKHASEKMRAGWKEILPENFLEAVGLIEYACEVEDCYRTFAHRADLESHIAEAHPLPFRCPDCLQRFDNLDLLNTHIDDEHSAPDSFSADASITPAIEQAWQSVLSQLQVEMPRASFDTWMRDTQPVRFDGNVLSIGVRNAYACAWLRERLQETLERRLRDCLQAPLTITFLVTTERDS